MPVLFQDVGEGLKEIAEEDEEQENEEKDGEEKGDGEEKKDKEKGDGEEGEQTKKEAERAGEDEKGWFLSNRQLAETKHRKFLCPQLRRS